MKRTLIEMVQEILNDLDSDFVNSIDDTVESQQIASILKSTYSEMMSNRNWPHLKKLVQLESPSDITKPVYLKVPEATKQMEAVEYDVRKITDTEPRYQPIKYKLPEEFLALVRQRKGDNVEHIVDFSGATIAVYNNKAPEYYTSFDDTYIVFDSYDASVSTTLTSNKTRCIAYIEPAWNSVDEFIPSLPDDAFSALVEEAKSTAFYYIKQSANQKAEQKASRQQRWLSRKAWRVGGGIQYPNYGRK